MNKLETCTDEEFKQMTREEIVNMMNNEIQNSNSSIKSSKDDEKYEEDVMVLDGIIYDIYSTSNKLDLKRQQFAKLYSEIESILLRHPNKIFYVVYEHAKLQIYTPITTIFRDGQKPTNTNRNDDIYDIVNARIYSENSIHNVIPSGIDLNKVCFSGGDKPCNYIKYPHYYGDEMVQQNKNIYCIQQLASEHKNLHFVHPKLLKYGKMFAHFK